jgi:hypothetical protein
MKIISKDLTCPFCQSPAELIETENLIAGNPIRLDCGSRYEKPCGVSIDFGHFSQIYSNQDIIDHVKEILNKE